MDIEEAAMNIFLPVMESAMVYAAHYCKSCGRNTITSMDMSYGWRYAARITTGNKLGSFFPEVYDDSDSSSTEEDSDDSSTELDEEDNDSSTELGEEEEFTRYTGETDELCIKMNEMYDTWKDWDPETPAEKMIKNAVDSSDGRIFSN